MILFSLLGENRDVRKWERIYAGAQSGNKLPNVSGSVCSMESEGLGLKLAAVSLVGSLPAGRSSGGFPAVCIVLRVFLAVVCFVLNVEEDCFSGRCVGNPVEDPLFKVLLPGEGTQE